MSFKHFLLWFFSPCSELQGRRKLSLTAPMAHVPLLWKAGWLTWTSYLDDLKDAVSHTFQWRDVCIFPRLETKVVFPPCSPQVWRHVVRSPLSILLWCVASGGRWMIFCCKPLIKKSWLSAAMVPITAVGKGGRAFRGHWQGNTWESHGRNFLLWMPAGSRRTIVQWFSLADCI